MIEQSASSTLSVRGLCRYFGTRVAVHGVDLELRQGDVLGLLGPNGAGKTTLMRMLTGNLAPSAGSVKICGIDLLGHPSEAKARMGYLPEIPPLYRELTVNEYLVFVARLHRLRNERIPFMVNRVMHRCGLDDTGKRLIGSLSKGYQQRVGIAQAIVHDPETIILDEPMVGLDPNQMQEIRDLIRELGRERSVIFSTHILSEVESVCNRIQIMHEGRTVFSDSVGGPKQNNSSLEEVFVGVTADTGNSASF